MRNPMIPTPREVIRQPIPIQPKKTELPRAPSAFKLGEPAVKLLLAGSQCNSNKSRSSKNSTGFEYIYQNISESTPLSNIRISHLHTNTAPVPINSDEMFLVRDQDTGNVFDIRQDQIPVNKEQLAKLKKRHKSAWQGWWQQKRENNNLLLQYTRANHIQQVEQLLDFSRDLKPEINIRDENCLTALHWSCLNQNYDMALLLLKNEADCEALNSQGQTPLLLCAQKGCDQIVSLLLTIGSDINHQDHEQNTALHYAVQFQHLRIIEILLARPSVSLAIRNLDGKLPTDLPMGYLVRQLFDRHLKIKKDSFNQCYRVPIHEQIPQQKYISHSRCTSPQRDIPQDEILSPNNIRIILQIGKGSFGDVYLVEKRSQKVGPKLAMKVLPKSKFIGHNLIRYALTERNILSFLNHPFIVKLRYAFQTNTHLCLLMDFCPGGDLSKILQTNRKIPEQVAKLYVAEILTALQHLHRNDIIYRDLKPENIVIDAQGHAMLTDFGLSKEGVRDNYAAKSFCGSMAYLAPEMLKRIGHGRPVDWYHLGILLYEMAVGKPPYFSLNREEMLDNIEHNKIHYPEYLSKECVSLITCLLEKNPINRLGASDRDADDIKEHPFFKGINWEDLLRRKYKAPPPEINQEILNQKFDIPFDFILSAEKASSVNYINGWSFVNNDLSQV